MPLFSVCIITASNETQAALYRKLIGTRLAAGLYPREIDFRVYCDPPAGRVGSGGGTLWALECFHKDTENAFRDEAHFPRILLIHAAGESRRLPAYVPEGKLFAPVSAPSSSATAPVVLDLIVFNQANLPIKTVGFYPSSLGYFFQTFCRMRACFMR